MLITTGPTRCCATAGEDKAKQKAIETRAGITLAGTAHGICEKSNLV
jgi:hypothetical protein